MRGDDVPARAPPIENHEVEQALLAAVLVDNRAYDKVADFLKAEHFSLGVHARIFQTIATLIDRGTIANPVTVGPFFANDEALREHGGASYLMRLAANVVSVANAADYGRQIFDLWKRRQLVSIADDITSRATTIAIDETADNIASESEERLFGVLSADARGGGPIAMADTLTSALEAMDTARQNGGKITGVPTGIDALDRMLGGLEPGELYVVAGRPSMGKSTLAHNIASHAARVFRNEAAPTGARPKSVLIFSLEMTAVNLSNWSLAAASGIDHSRIRHGRVSAQEVDDLVGAAGALRSLPIAIDDTPRLSVAEMRLRARRIARGPGGLGLLVVDHLGLISPPKELLGQGETAQITEITRSLKALAKELGVPLIALSQLNRGVEARDDKRPLLADLRSSGSIEQDADVVMFVYREHYYLSREEPVEKPGENEQKFRDRQATHDKRLHDTVNTAQIIVAKHRVGATGHVDCYWDGARAIFGDRPADVDRDTLL